MFNNLMANELKPFIGRAVYLSDRRHGVVYTGILLDINATFFKIQHICQSGEPKGIEVGKTDDITSFQYNEANLLKAELEYHFQNSINRVIGNAQEGARK